MEFDLALRIMVGHLECHVVRHAFAVGPAPGRQIWLDSKFNDSATAAIADLISQVVAFTGFPLAIPASCMNSSELSASRTDTTTPWVPRSPCSCGTAPLLYGFRESPLASISSYSIPQG